MKIRQGFVSNSSSSSFIAIAIIVDINDITNEMIADKNITTFGKYKNEGIDKIDIDSNIKLNYFKLFPSYDDYGYCNKFVFYNIIKTDFDDDICFTKKELKDDVEYTTIEKTYDYHCSQTIDDLFDIYQPDIDVKDNEKYLNQLIREQKLKRIIK